MLSFAYQKLKKHQYSTIIPILLVGIDFGTILILLDQVGHIPFFIDIDMQSYLFLSISLALCWIIAGVFTGSYQIENLGRVKHVMLRSVFTSGVYFGLILILIGLRSDSKVNIILLIELSLLALIVVTIVRMFLLQFYRVVRHFTSNHKNAIIIGNTKRGKELSRYFFTNTSLPQKYLGFFDNEPPTRLEDFPFYLGKLDEVKKYCLDNNVKEIYYALDQQRSFFTELMVFADKHFIFLGILPDVDGMDFDRRVDTILYNDSRIPVITARKAPLHLIVNWSVKRVFDIIFSVCVLIGLFLTIYPLIAIAIKLDSPGPILYKQLRPGRNNKLFWCYKFRTMKVDSNDQQQATRNDNRITKVGAFLRRTSLDELPQFYNVLIGDMSVVGPRPNLVVHLEKYSEEIKDYPIRHWITPGITGYAQVSGYRGETREIYLMHKRIEYDLLYIENWRLTLDLQIIFQTVWNMIRGDKNAY